MRVPNLHTAPKRHLIKIRTFLKKIDSYLEKYKFARRFKGLRLPNFLKFSTAIKHLTNFRTTNLKLLLSIQILCASHFKFVWKYAPPLDSKHLNFRFFFFYSTHWSKLLDKASVMHNWSQWRPYWTIPYKFTLVLLR